MRATIAVILATGALVMAALLYGCDASSSSATDNAPFDDAGEAVPSGDVAGGDAARADADGFDFAYSDRDQDTAYDGASATAVTFNGSGAEAHSAAGDTATNVRTSDGAVTLTAEGCYVISGSLSEASLIIDAPDDAKVQVVFNGVRIENSAGPAVLVESADKVFITLAEGSTNVLNDGTGRSDLPTDGASVESAAEVDITEDDTAEEHATHDATLFSHDDLTINGSGALTVSSLSAHAIVSKDDLVICGGTFALNAATDALQGKDCVKIVAGDFAITAGDDAITSTNTDKPDSAGFVTIDGGSLVINAGDDALHAETILRLTGGSVEVVACEEGYEGAQIWLDGGQHTIISADDGLNAAGEARTDFLLDITGGTLVVTADGDGIDSNGTLAQSGGEVLINGPTNSANGALDATRATITGGTMLALGAAGMAQTYGEGSTQAALLYQAAQTLPAGVIIRLIAADGSELISHTAIRPFSSIAYSSPALAQGESYTLEVEGEQSVSFTLTEAQAAISADGMVSAYTGGMGGMGGGPGDRGNGGFGGGPGGGPSGRGDIGRPGN
ncbi:MAG: carbohydrate-binding domain-containing protein [Coriobacteriales bacterium]|jgi:hypothetical protein|nr:carbohydrate-binding domain-containing protein [Coriobacteriales bacterium]